MNTSVSSKASELLQDWRGSWGARGGCWCYRCRLRGRRRGWPGSVRAGRARGGHRLAWLAATHTAGSRRCCRCCCCSRPEAGEEGDRTRKNGTLIYFFFFMMLPSSSFNQTQQHDWEDKVLSLCFCNNAHIRIKSVALSLHLLFK